jgi:hypothetical protein
VVDSRPAATGRRERMKDRDLMTSRLLGLLLVVACAGRRGPWRPGRAAPAHAQTTYRVARGYLTGYIGLKIRGGLDLRGTEWVPTEHVVCNDATLIIGAEPDHSFFYGDLVQLDPKR